MRRAINSSDGAEFESAAIPGIPEGFPSSPSELQAVEASGNGLGWGERGPCPRSPKRRNCDWCGQRGAVDAGDIVLIRSDPRDVARIVQLSRLTYRKMIQNLWWAAGYNILAIPLAAGVLANQGFVPSPAIATVLMSASTVMVAAMRRC